GDGAARGARGPRARSADAVLRDETVEGLAVDAGRLGGGRDVAVVALQQAAKIRGLEHAHPLLLGVLERQRRRFEPGVPARAAADRAAATQPGARQLRTS